MFERGMRGWRVERRSVEGGGGDRKDTDVQQFDECAFLIIYSSINDSKPVTLCGRSSWEKKYRIKRIISLQPIFALIYFKRRTACLHKYFLTGC